MLNLVYHDTQDERVYAALSQRMRDRFDIFGSLPDTIDDDWIEDIGRLEEMMDKYMHLRQHARDAFEIRYERESQPGQRSLGTLLACARTARHRRKAVRALVNRQRQPIQPNLAPEPRRVRWACPTQSGDILPKG